MTLLRITALAAALVAFPALSEAQSLLGRDDSVFTWRGALPSGAQVTVRNHNGPIDVRPASGSQLELRAEKRSRFGNLTDVAFDIRTEGDGDVAICSTLRGDDPCGEGRRAWDGDDDGRRGVTVAMTLLVPRGARVRVATGNGAVSVERVGGGEVVASTGNGRVTLVSTEGTVRASTGNGDVQVRDATGAVRASTGNGRVSVTTAEGPVDARTGNGDIDVRMTALRAADDMTFSTGSGDVRVTLPAGYNGELDASTGNGTISSDFELRIEGRMSPRRVRATIGSGGARLRLVSGNGGLEVRKAK